MTGNQAVHPGEMLADDVDYVAQKMFGLINYIVKKAISDPKELEELYKKTPASMRASAEEIDRKARGDKE